MARYLLNSAVVTAPGRYDYRLITAAEARAWFSAGPVQSTIGYQETADALAELLGNPIAVDRRTITMDEGDSALVFQLAFPPGTPRIDPRDKGALGLAVLAGHYELGLLTRLGGDLAPVAREKIAQLWPLVKGPIPEGGITLTHAQGLALRGVCSLLAEQTALARSF